MDDYKEICDAVKEGIRIKLEKRSETFKEFGAAETVRAEHARIDGMSREMSVSEHNLVAMPHFGQYLEQIRRKNGRNALKKTERGQHCERR